MNFTSLFQGKSKYFLVYLGLFGMINSLWAGALLMLINNKIIGEPLPYFNDYDWAAYLGLIVVSFASATIFQSYMIRLSHDLGNELGLSIFDKLRFTGYQDFNKLGEEKVRTAMEDVKVIQTFPEDFLEFFSAAVMVVIGLGYLFFVDAASAGIVTGVLVLLAIIYVYRDNKIEDALDQARELNDTYQSNVNDFLRGFRSIKMSTNRSDIIFDNYITKNRNAANKLTIKGLIRLLGNELLGTYVWYLMLGVILFALPYLLQMNQAVMSSFLVTLLFLMGPSNTIVGLLQAFVKFRIAWGRLNKFDEEIDAQSSYQLGHGEDVFSGHHFEEICFDKVTYEYHDQKGNLTFKLRPLNLKVNRGEIIFITGGNGSGKSTFIHLLSGLYQPKGGGIYFNDVKVTDEIRASYRNQLTCIFTDNYLFTDNYDGFDLSQNNKTFADLIAKMQLNGKINFDEERNRVFHTLSKGQQKRMALIYSLLEEKEIFIFDEWAAEQDPVFRKYFYENIIPELKEMGKTVIAVTHDDAYFDCAERILKFDYGRILEDKAVLKLPEEVNIEKEPMKLVLNGVDE